MLKTNQICLHYGSSQILYNISIEAMIGEITCLMGSNGVGKTSLLKVLSGNHPSSSGNYILNEKDVTNFEAHKLASRGVGYVPQGRFIFPLLTVEENLMSGFAVLKKDERYIPKLIFDLFPVLKKMLSRKGGDLSGGQQQQLAIARALIMQPKLLLLDEPTEGIQPNIVIDIENAVKTIIRESNIGVLLVEQHLHFVKQANNYYAMQRGGIVASGPTSELSKDIIEKFLGV